MDSVFQFLCRGCQAPLQIPRAQLPAEGPCPHCGTQLQVVSPTPIMTETKPNVQVEMSSYSNLAAALGVGISMAAAIAVGAFAYSVVNYKLSETAFRVEEERNYSVAEILPTTTEESVIVMRMSEIAEESELAN